MILKTFMLLALAGTLTSPEQPYIAHAGSRVYLPVPVPTATGYKAYWRQPGGVWQGPFYDKPAYYPDTGLELLTHNGNVPLIRHLAVQSGIVVEICMSAYNEGGESDCSESVFVLWPEYEELFATP